MSIKSAIENLRAIHKELGDIADETYNRAVLPSEDEDAAALDRAAELITRAIETIDAELIRRNI